MLDITATVAGFLITSDLESGAERVAILAQARFSCPLNTVALVKSGGDNFTRVCVLVVPS